MAGTLAQTPEVLVVGVVQAPLAAMVVAVTTAALVALERHPQYLARLPLMQAAAVEVCITPPEIHPELAVQAAAERVEIIQPVLVMLEPLILVVAVEGAQGSEGLDTQAVQVALESLLFAMPIHIQLQHRQRVRQPLQ